MNTKVISTLDDIIKKFKSNKLYELELKYDNEINKGVFEKIIENYKKQNLELTESKTLDISFMYKTNNYRITIDGNNIDKYSKTNIIQTFRGHHSAHKLPIFRDRCRQQDN